MKTTAGIVILLPLVSAQAVTSAAGAQATKAIDPALIGTWTTSSQKVVTGPGFYDPVNDKMTEPEMPGISYSFTQDGWYEEAYYRAVANPSTPSCPQAVMQWQHGTFQQLANNSLVLTPIQSDGRQQLSDPCSYDQSIYTQYSQAEFFLEYQTVLDPYHGVQRLNLFQFDGTPMNPMYLAYHPTPQMLPTATLNPTASSTSAGQATSTTSSKRKRSEPGSFDIPRNTKILLDKKSGLLNPDTWWWFGVGATALGGLAYYAF